MCSMHILPFILGTYFMQPGLKGTMIDNINRTYDLSDCILTHNGTICNGVK